MHFELYKDMSGEFRTRLVAKNGNTVMDSAEGYKKKAGALKITTKLLDKDSRYMPVRDTTKKK